ncbi:hypothetical protein EXIGLDRAFT_299058 [Exidia glandulosa HHB12029]|uniref:Uncharacterized protein n=1 Tax=Exidia glandulosa HHB12029 TaxID=1314781 RepID=A0A166B7I8_EXIGL|nr:hypothetical protein EXIGLDRAFT_299058 [Exidia glandulosa HHB12029]
MPVRSRCLAVRCALNSRCRSRTETFLYAYNLLHPGVLWIRGCHTRRRILITMTLSCRLLRFLPLLRPSFLHFAAQPSVFLLLFFISC